MSAEQLAAESDKSPGVLMASGYIAGGAIAGIVIAFMAGVLMGLDETLTRWAAAHNPFYAGASADLLALRPLRVAERAALPRWPGEAAGGQSAVGLRRRTCTPMLQPAPGGGL